MMARRNWRRLKYFSSKGRYVALNRLMAALQTATRNPAQFMGQSDRRGTVEAGKIADLVLLDADPLADIHNTRSVRAVVLSVSFTGARRSLRVSEGGASNNSRVCMRMPLAGASAV